MADKPKDAGTLASYTGEQTARTTGGGGRLTSYTGEPTVQTTGGGGGGGRLTSYGGDQTIETGGGGGSLSSYWGDQTIETGGGDGSLSSYWGDQTIEIGGSASEPAQPGTTGSGSGTWSRQEISEHYNPKPEEANIDRVGYYDRQYLTDLATQQIETARQQYNQRIDRAMDTQAVDLNRALADAQGQFRNQQNQVAANERQAMDNAALYAQARGDQGGIGLAQYNSIQNNAAKNKLAVSQAQTKLATDTARQISDLRAQGEFGKADKMLELTQTYLSELRAIEEYAAKYNLSVDQMNTAIAEWEAEFNRASQQYWQSTEMSLAQMTGSFSDGTPTYAAQQAAQRAQADLAISLIQSGVDPSKLTQSQLSALQQYYGMSMSEIRAYYKKYKKTGKTGSGKKSRGGSTGGGGGGGGGGDAASTIAEIIGSTIGGIIGSATGSITGRATAPRQTPTGQVVTAPRIPGGATRTQQSK